MGICGFGESICAVSDERLVIRDIHLNYSSNGKYFGYYQFLLVEHSECKCTNDTAIMDRIDGPFHTPPIFDSRLIKASSND